MSSSGWIREAASSQVLHELRNFVSNRRLVSFFARQSLLKFTRRTILGVLWLPIRCFAPFIGAAFVARAVLSVDDATIPYPVFLIAGALPWTLFATSAYWITRSLELSRRFIRSHHQSLLVYPSAYFAPALVNGAMIGLLLIGLLVFYRNEVSPQLFHDPLAILLLVDSIALMLMQGATVGLFLALLALRTRDTRFALGYALAALLLMTPVAYSLSSVTPDWRGIAQINPVGIGVEAFRYALLGQGDVDPARLGVVGIGTLVLFSAAVALVIKNESYVKRHA